MQHELELSEQQIDCLKELVNLAMGDGAKALANYCQRFVVLSVPYINALSLAELPGACRYSAAIEPSLSIVQCFSCLGQPGAILLRVSQPYLRDFATMTAHESANSGDLSSCLTQLAGMLNPIILSRLARELAIDVSCGQVISCEEDKHQAAGSPALEAGAYNLCFSYALEAASDENAQSEEADSLAEYRLAKAGKPAFGLDVVIRAPLAMLHTFSQLFTARVEA